MLFPPLTAEERHALSEARTYHAASADASLKPLDRFPRSEKPDGQLGVHITWNHRQGLSKYSENGLWSMEEALFTRSALLQWRQEFRLEDVMSDSLVSQGLTSLIPTNTTSEEQLLEYILCGHKQARITEAELRRAEKEPIGVFALSYRHQGPKGKNITLPLWKDALTVANTLAACAGFRYFTLWIDTVSAAAKGEKEVQGYVDWFTIGVAPYLLLPTILLADERDRKERMWLRMEEKLSQYGLCCVYALRNRGKLVRLEPGPLEVREPYERIWCMCQSVVRGEYNRLETSYYEDYLNLLKWATEFEKHSVDFKGLSNVFSRGSDNSFKQELPIEQGCYIVLNPHPQLECLHGAESFAGRVEYLTATDDTQGLQSLKKEAQRGHSDQQVVLLKTRNGKQLSLQQLHSLEGRRHISKRRWRSYASSTLLIVETVKDRSSGQCRICRTVVVGAAFEDCDCMSWDFTAKYGLEVIPESVRNLLGIAKTTVVFEEKVSLDAFYNSIST